MKDSVMVIVNISRNEPLEKPSIHKSIVSCRVMMVKDDSTSKLAITKFVLKCLSSSQNENESLIVYWLYVSDSNNGTKNFAS